MNLKKLAKLPNSENAFVDIKKLKDYCLNLSHERGKHKARLFSALLDIKKENADKLKKALLKAAGTKNAKISMEDQYGARYIIDFVMKNSKKTVKVRSIWIVRKQENFARLTTCYIL